MPSPAPLRSRPGPDLIRAFLCLIAGAIAGYGAIGLGRAQDQAGPLSVNIATSPAAEGRTEIDLQVLKEALERRAGVLSRLGLQNVVPIPQAGVVSARTHSSPLLLKLTVTGIDPARVIEILPRGPVSLAGLLAPLKTQLTAAVARLAVRTMALGALGGLVVSFVFRGRILGAFAGVAAGAAAPAVVFALTAASFDLNAFSNPSAAVGAGQAAVAILAIGSLAGRVTR